MQNYQTTPDYYRDYIEHGVGTNMIKNLTINYINNRRKKNGQQPLPSEEEALKALYENRKKSKENQTTTKKEHKYIRKYFKNGHFIYVYRQPGVKKRARLASDSKIGG